MLVIVVQRTEGHGASTFKLAAISDIELTIELTLTLDTGMLGEALTWHPSVLLKNRNTTKIQIEFHLPCSSSFASSSFDFSWKVEASYSGCCARLSLRDPIQETPPVPTWKIAPGWPQSLAASSVKHELALRLDIRKRSDATE